MASNDGKKFEQKLKFDIDKKVFLSYNFTK